jgi:hypothetical protein
MPSRLTLEEWTVAQQVCTKEQLIALDYWRRDAGYKTIAMAVGVSRDSARGRIDRALDRITRELERRAAA